MDDDILNFLLIPTISIHNVGGDLIIYYATETEFDTNLGHYFSLVDNIGVLEGKNVYRLKVDSMYVDDFLAIVKLDEL